MLVFKCSSCQSTLQIDDQYAGRDVTCPGCANLVKAPAATSGSQIQAAPAKPAPEVLDAVEAEPRPKRKRRREDDDDAPPKKTGSVGWLVAVGIALACIVPCCGIIGVALLIPAVQKVRQAAANLQEQNNFKQIAIGAHNHHDTFTHFPTAKVFSQQKLMPVNLSWRVSILPFMEQQALFQSIAKDQDFNSPQNMAASNIVVIQYVSVSRKDVTPPNMTFAQTFTGPNTIYPQDATKVRMQEITDGTSNTLLYGEAFASVPWMKGAEMQVNANGPIPVNQGTFIAGMADGSTRRIDRNRVADDMLRKLLDPRDGQALPVDWENGGR